MCWLKAIHSHAPPWQSSQLPNKLMVALRGIFSSEVPLAMVSI
ncbi:hypothetical protein YSA_07152 [Pseudomonas putida ND6]|uniref:Uncharacterized protein n=1 Tax=Pseudomonas putida ND6 TaxID=231023 RepID=I3UYR3_PSEPU|nr:hypothetical protein YSA_07152 [Pseudomonas putida ND6]